jgi:protein-disulfide isomerase
LIGAASGNMKGELAALEILRKLFAGTAALAAVVITGLAVPASGRADPGRAPLSPDQVQAMEALIHEYILGHPEVILESLQLYQAEQEQTERRESAAALASAKDQLERDPASPVAGDPNGDVTIVEFFDYNCGYCKRVLSTIQEILKTDKRIRYVFKEFPILGPDSATAARAALAVWKLAPEKYLDFHAALMSGRGALNEDRILRTVGEIGLDGERVRDAMADPAIDDALRSNLELGRRMRVSGTPAFVIGGRLVPGAISLAQLRDLVAEARKG